MITSVQNSKVKEIKLLQQKSKLRKQTQTFVVEGIRLIEEVIKANWKIDACFFVEDLGNRGEELVTTITDKSVIPEEVSPHVMKAISDVDSPPGLLVIVKQNEFILPSSLDFILVGDKIRDPGNLGTMIRSAVAAGAQQLILTEGSVDPFSPKVIRSGMGAHFRMPILQKTIVEIIAIAGNHNLKVFVADGNSQQTYFEQNFKEGAAIVIGSEANGPDPSWQQYSPININIPTSEQSESLNAAVAASIMMFEVARQRGTNL
jgi:RNA methyltransferase, TrmH family